jgi:hypothetical protein
MLQVVPAGSRPFGDRLAGTLERYGFPADFRVVRGHDCLISSDKGPFGPMECGARITGVYARGTDAHPTLAFVFEHGWAVEFNAPAITYDGRHPCNLLVTSDDGGVTSMPAEIKLV